MFTFACKWSSRPEPAADNDQLSANQYADMATKYVEYALAQCGDDAPPLCILQALILTTHWMIIQGVRGKAWRYVGVCIRLLYELGLHSIDAEQNSNSAIADPDKWCLDEEGRRAYWAVWEMDQYSSHIEHVPITSDWTRDGVHLPAEDERWFAGRPQKSCALALDLIDRCRNLQGTGSKSARAWYIVIASLNAASHDIVYSRSLTRRLAKDQVRVIADRWPALFNTIQLSKILLPQELQFHGQYLDFGTQTMGHPPDAAVLQRHSVIYEIALMPEVSKITALRPYVFDAYMRKLLARAQETEGRTHAADEISEDLARKLDQCFKSADCILNLILNCHESHYLYVNPYVTQVSWLGATVQLLQQELTDDESQKQLIRSKFEVFKATNDKFMQHWGMSVVPKENLETLEARLKQFTAASQSLMSREHVRAARRNNTLSQKAVASTTARYPRGSSLDTRSDYLSNFAERSSVATMNAHVAEIRSETRLHHHSTQPEGCDRHNQITESPAATQRSPPPVQGLNNASLDNPFQPFYEQTAPSLNPIMSSGDVNVSLWDENRGLGSYYPTADADPIDWLSIFSSIEMDTGLTDYLEMFSASYV